MTIVDTPAQSEAFFSNQLGTVLQEEGITNDLNSVINGARRALNLGVSDRIEVHLFSGDIVRWAAYWNRVELMRGTLCDRLYLNGDDVTPPNTSTAMVTVNPDTQDAKASTEYSRTTIGGSLNFPVLLRIEKI